MANKILKSRRLWIITIVVFVGFVAIFDRNNFIDRARTLDEIEVLREQRDYYLERIRKDSATIEKLKDDDFLEQYARENFLMRMDGETVYVMEPAPQNRVDSVF